MRYIGYILLVLFLTDCSSNRTNNHKTGHNYYDSNNKKSKQWKNQKKLQGGKKYKRPKSS